MKRLGLSQAIGAVALLFFAASVSSGAQTFTTIFDFNQTDGEAPNFVMQGYDGNLYGTTASGGARGDGTVFQFTPDGTLTTLYSFCSRKDCTDGEAPFSLVQTSDGSFYGVTGAGGYRGASCSGCGTFFQLTPGGGFRLLHSFCSQANCTDGYSPTGQLIQGIDGNFYGTTAFGGAYNHGIVYSITPGGKLTVLHSFCALANCADGAEPYPGVIQANNGVLYGTTSFGGQGGSLNQGTVFQLTTSGKFTSLYSFSNNGQDSIPNGLIQGADGNLYGSSSSIGTTGTVFQFTLTGKYTTLHTFCQSRSCFDGSDPNGMLTQGTDGRLYGTTILGGAGGNGTLFAVTRTGGFALVYSFCAGSAGCIDGTRSSGVMQYTSGLFYGLTSTGASSAADGTIYSISYGLRPFVKVTPALGKVGMTVGILGNNLTGTTGVAFNGTPAVFNVVSDTYITATLPSGATTGTIEVTTPSGTLSSNVPFRVFP